MCDDLVFKHLPHTKTSIKQDDDRFAFPAVVYPPGAPALMRFLNRADHQAEQNCDTHCLENAKTRWRQLRGTSINGFERNQVVIEHYNQCFVQCMKREAPLVLKK